MTLENRALTYMLETVPLTGEIQISCSAERRSLERWVIVRFSIRLGWHSRLPDLLQVCDRASTVPHVFPNSLRVPCFDPF
jgi:hypothetical protein